MKCQNCGIEIPSGELNCPSCQDMASKSNPNKEGQGLVYVFLAVFIVFFLGFVLYAYNALSGTSTTDKGGSNDSQQLEIAESAPASANPSIPFTNKYGTRTTLCAHTGCNNYIAPSGDTNCCTTHSHRCIDCNCYIDEDAMFCISCLEKAAKQATASNTHYCEACGKEALYSIIGITGTKEYYCYQHYYELKELLEGLLG